MPGTKTSEKSWKTRSRSANEMETYKELTAQAPAFPQLQRGRPSATVRACANESLPPRAAGAARQSTTTPQPAFFRTQPESPQTSLTDPAFGSTPPAP